MMLKLTVGEESDVLGSIKAVDIDVALVGVAIAEVGVKDEQREVILVK